MSPTVSVVLPVYNGERYLRASIDSVLTQSLQDFEFIIWDDASTDSSREIISSYSDPRIRVFENNSNLGLFKTLNLIITNSSGPLIKLWSQDDVMKEDCLNKLTSFLSTQNMAAMAYCAYDLFDCDGKVYKPAPPDQTPETIDPRLAAQIMFYNGSLTGNIANVILRRSALDEVGLFREDMMVSGDFEMWVRLSERWPTGFLNESLLLLRSHEEQFSRRKGIYVQFMKEDREIVDTLLRRLPLELRSHARRYEVCQRQVLYFHYLLRCLLSGNWSTASQTYREIAKQSRFGLVALIWLLTANHRLYRIRPKYA